MPEGLGNRRNRKVLMPSTLILGGARSGKSRYALALGRQSVAVGERVFVATAVRSDDEMSARIDKHRADRGSEWRTVEEPVELAQVISEQCVADSVVVVDCLTQWLNNLMLHERDVSAELDALVDSIEGATGELIIVSNELGLGLVPDTPLGRSYRDWHGTMNQRIAAICDRVVLMVAGLPLTVK